MLILICFVFYVFGTPLRDGYVHVVLLIKEAVKKIDMAVLIDGGTAIPPSGVQELFNVTIDHSQYPPIIPYILSSPPG